MFLCYRREDASGHAGRLYDAITAHLPLESVFMDIDTIEPGVDFVEVVEEAVGSCDVLLALIGQRWLRTSNETGAPRLQDANDYVRLEIEAALERQIRVIPVLIQDSHMPSAQELPEGMRALARRNAIEISDHRWRYDVDQLLRVLIRVREAAESKSTTSPQRSAPATTVSLSSNADQTALPLNQTPTVGKGQAAPGTDMISHQGSARSENTTPRPTGRRVRWNIIVIAFIIIALVLTALLLDLRRSNSSTIVTTDGFVTVTGAGLQTTPTLHTSGPSDLLVAMVSTEYSHSIVVTGGGLVWTKVARYAGTDSTSGQDIEIWMARDKVASEHLTVSSSMTGTPVWLQSLSVMAFKGASGVGAIASSCFSTTACPSNSAAPKVTLTPTHAGSMIIGVGYDYSDDIARFADRGQVIDQQAFDRTERATMWVQHAISLTRARSPVTIGDAVAAGDDWALTAFEVKPSHR